MDIDLSANPPKATLFSEDAEIMAIKISGNLTERDKVNKPTQIRRFYDELVGWQERVNNDIEKFKQLEAFIKMMSAKVAYAKGRGLVDNNFYEWFNRCVKKTNDCNTLNNFRLHFEAVLGYLKAIRG